MILIQFFELLPPTSTQNKSALRFGTKVGTVLTKLAACSALAPNQDQEAGVVLVTTVTTNPELRDIATSTILKAG